MGLLRRSGSKGAEAGGGRKPLSAASAKRMIGVGRTVAPLLAPYALVAAGAIRARWDNYRADRLGVTPDQLAAFRGPGGALHARLGRVAEALDRLDQPDAAHGTGAARTFATDTRPRIADLAIAVRAAGRWPVRRRRAAYRAIAGQLDRIESALLTHLGVAT